MSFVSSVDLYRGNRQDFLIFHVIGSGAIVTRTECRTGHASLSVERINYMSISNEELNGAKWGWACRLLSMGESFSVEESDVFSAADVVVGRVESIGLHSRIANINGARERIYPGDLVVGVMGNRYASDAFHGVAIVKEGKIDLMTNAGMVGTVLERNSGSKEPTRLAILGRLLGANGSAVNLVERGLGRDSSAKVANNVIYVLGTGMNAGKTTSAARMIRSMKMMGFKLAALKVTGSVSQNDQMELAAAGADYVADFSDYGYPSTYLLSISELRALVLRMLRDAQTIEADYIVVEVADGVLQTETAALLKQGDILTHVVGAILAAPCALSALQGVEEVERNGIPILAVTGRISNAPLATSEFRSRSMVPILDSNERPESFGQQISLLLKEARSSRSKAA